jgi:orotidine-5'-phosphate decarboxylase
VTETYLDRLGARQGATRTVLCVGLDPHPDGLPAGFSADLRGIEAFGRLIVEATRDVAAAFKANLAFFEAYGSAGMAALERLRVMVPPEIPFIADAKRADIGSTAERQAVALFDVLGADAITVSPYLGGAAIGPLLDRPERFAYVLCRTSNPGAGEIQDLDVARAGETALLPLHLAVARAVASWGPGGTVGLVVGATAPAELASVRAAAPALPFLVPGVGAQGGSIQPVLAAGPTAARSTGRRPGGGLLVNVSRGIAGAATGPAGEDPGERLAAAGREWASRLPVLP